MDLICVNRSTINWIVTVHFITFGIAGLLFWQVPDLKGNRKTFKLFGTIHILCQWLMILVPNYWVRLLSFGLMGFC